MGSNTPATNRLMPTDHSEGKLLGEDCPAAGPNGYRTRTRGAALGGDPRHGGLAGASQSLWPHAEAGEPAATSDLDGPGDEAQREVYRRALQADLPLNVRMLVQRQNVEISSIRRRAAIGTVREQCWCGECKNLAVCPASHNLVRFLT